MKLNIFKEYAGLRKELYILFIGRIVTNLGSTVWSMFTLILSQKLGFEAGTIGIALTILTLVSLPLNLLGGKLADKFNKKNIIVICDLVSIGAYIYCFFVPITLTTIIVFCIASLFQNVEYASYDALVADFTTSEDRERAYSLSYLGGNLGLILAPTLGGLLFNNYLNLAFLINGISIGISTILIFFFIKNVSKEVDTSVAAEYEKEVDAKTSPFKILFQNKVVLMFIISMAVYSGVYMMFGYLIPLDFAAVYGENGPSIFGTINSVNCVIVVVFTWLITKLFKKLMDVDKIITGNSLILIGYIIFLFFIKELWVCYIAIVIFTWGEIFSTIANSPFLTKRIPASHRGRIISISNVVGSLFSCGTEVAIGFAYEKCGRIPAWIIVCCLNVLCILLLFIVRYFDKKEYRNLYYGVTMKDGVTISVKTMTESLVHEYFKGFETDPCLYDDPSNYQPYTYSKEKVDEYWNKAISDSTRKNFLIMMDGSPIGEIILKHIDLTDKSCELSIHMQKDEYKNKGYGTEAEKLIVRYAFSRFGVEKIKANVILNNVRSQHVLEKAGFVQTNKDDKFVYYEIVKLV